MKRIIVLQVGGSMVKVVSYLQKTIYLLSDLFLVQRRFLLCIRPTLKNRPESIRIHCGTNNLKNNEPQSIADNILSLDKSSQQ